MDESCFGLVNYVWVKKFCDLVKIWGKYEGFMVMEVLEGCLRDERCLCWRMKGEERKKKNLRNFFFCWWVGTPCHHRHDPCQPSGKIVVFFIFFWIWLVWFLVNGFKKISHHIWTNTYKTTQNKQNKSNKTRGLPPTKRSFKVISLTVRSFTKVVKIDYRSDRELWI